MIKIAQVNLTLTNIFLEDIMEFDFEKLKSDIELLAEQPPVKVYPTFKEEEIDYKTGYRSIIVRSKSDKRPIRLLYTIMDRAGVIGSVNYSEFVGIKKYTQQEVDELRSQRG